MVSQLEKTGCKSDFSEEQFLSRVPKKSSIRCSRNSAGVCYNSLVRVWLAEKSKCQGRLRLVDNIMKTRLASDYSTYWPTYALKTKLYGFYSRPLKSLCNNASPGNTNSTIKLWKLSWNLPPAHTSWRQLQTFCCVSCFAIRSYVFDLNLCP